MIEKACYISYINRTTGNNDIHDVEYWYAHIYKQIAHRYYSMFNKFKRNIKVIHVFHKYRIFSIIFNESKRRYDTVDLCTCSIDHQRRDNAIRLRMAFEELGPTFTKLGQAMSKRTDLVPVEYGRELEKLQESVQAYDFEKMQESFNLVCNISSKETGTYSDITSLFDEFNTEPIASASIAQVYEAVLDGKDVVIKIPRPGMEDIIKLDLDILYDVKFFVRKILRIKIYIDIDGFLDEFKYMLIRELDYRNEALNMERFRDNFNNTKDVHIPKVCWELSNDNILVMEQIKGIPVWDYKGLSISQRKKLAKLISYSFLKMVYIDGFFHADPHASNIFVMKDGSIAYLDFGAIGKIDNKTKKDMYAVFYAVYIKDVDMACESFLRLAQMNPDNIDMRMFKWDMDELISRYHYEKSKHHSDDFIKLALKYDLSLPKSFSLLERALVLVESTCLNLDPDYNIMSDIKDLSKDIVRMKLSPSKMFEDFQMEWDNFYDMLRKMPTGINDIFDTIKMIKSANLSTHEITVLKKSMMDHILQYVFLTILLIISIILLTSYPDLEIIGLIGFVISIILGIIMLFRKE